MRRHRRGYRLMGAIWAAIGGTLSIVFFVLTLNPEATIVYNGVVTSESGPKLFGALFGLAFCLAGVGFMLIPGRYLYRFLVYRQSFLNSLMFWR